MLDRLFSLFRPAPAPRLVIVGPPREQESAAEIAALQDKQIAYLSELGGFDTFFDNAPLNWMRQAEILVEHKRRLDAIEAKLTKIID